MKEYTNKYSSCDNERCSTEECHSGNECRDGHGDEHCRFFLELADCAWAEVLKEKIKDHIKKNDSEYLDRLAELVAGANKKRWKNKMAKKNDCHEFSQSICDLFSCSDKGKYYK